MIAVMTRPFVFRRNEELSGDGGNTAGAPGGVFAEPGMASGVGGRKGGGAGPERDGGAHRSVLSAVAAADGAASADADTQQVPGEGFDASVWCRGEGAAVAGADGGDEDHEDGGYRAGLERGDSGENDGGGH